MTTQARNGEGLFSHLYKGSEDIQLPNLKMISSVPVTSEHNQIESQTKRLGNLLEHLYSLAGLEKGIQNTLNQQPLFMYKTSYNLDLVLNFFKD